MIVIKILYSVISIIACRTIHFHISTEKILSTGI